MDATQNNQPPVTPAPQSTGWSAIAGGVIAAALVGAGVFYLIQAGYFAPQDKAQETYMAPEEQNAQNTDLGSIETDLNTGGEANTEADLSELEQSL